MLDVGLFCISLDRRSDRWRSVEERLRRLGFEAERIEAVDGRRLAIAAEAGYGALGRRSPGELGCLMSHRRAIETALRRGLSRVLVMEDDVCFHQRFAQRWAEVDGLAGDSDLLYLGCSQYDRRGVKFVNQHCYRARKTLGSFAYSMRRRLFETFLDVTAPLDLPVDVALSRLQDDPANICLVCHPPLAIADVRQSDIRGARDLERHAARMGWRLSEYEVPQQPNPLCRTPPAERQENRPSAVLQVERERHKAEDRPVRSAPAHERPEVLLAIDRFGWAFHADANGLVKHLSDDFSFTIVRYGELTADGRQVAPRRSVEGDLLVAFWWQSLLGIDTSRVGSVVCGLFETWSWDVHGAEQLQAALDKADVLVVANAYILDDLRNHPAGFRPPAVFVCEEGVDCDLFRPQPFPPEFCVGWAGTTANARGYRGQPDGKGLGLIQEAARLAGVRLLSAEREDAGRGGATAWQIGHAAMAEEYYRRVSAHCIGSYSEGAPLTAAEALACGRPVISTNVGVVPQLVQHGVNGLIVPREAAALAAAMREIERLGPEAMSAAARRSALLFDWSRQAPKWAHAFHSALDPACRRTRVPIAPRPEYAAGEWRVRRFAAR